VGEVGGGSYSYRNAMLFRMLFPEKEKGQVEL